MTECRMVGSGKGNMESCYLMGIAFQLCRMKMFWSFSGDVVNRLETAKVYT